MSDIKQTNSPFLEVCDCCVGSTQPMSGFLSALDGQAIADPTTIPFDHSSYAVENPLFVSLLTRGESSQEREIPSLTPADVAMMFEFIQNLRRSNTNLLETVVQLQQALADCQEDLAVQKEHKLTTELMLAQKLDDLADAEDQVECLSEKLKTAHQTIQRQQISIKTLTTELTTSQERIAQMERECSLAAANYNEKSQILLETEDSCRELRARLVRQQRYTMQLKVALEKCQDVPLRSFATQPDSDCLYSVTNEQTVYQKQAPSLFPKAQPITPWVEQSLYLNEELPTIARSTVSSQTHHEQRLTTDDQSTLFNSSTFSVEQSFFFTRNLDAQEDANWEDLSSLLDAEEETDNRADLILEHEDLAQGEDSTQPKTKPSQVNPNWPSPVIAPSHPSKDRKSLSAIELPNFVQKRK